MVWVGRCSVEFRSEVDVFTVGTGVTVSGCWRLGGLGGLRRLGGLGELGELRRLWGLSSPCPLVTLSPCHLVSELRAE